MLLGKLHYKSTSKLTKKLNLATPLRLETLKFIGHFCWWFSSLLTHHPSSLTQTHLVLDILLPPYTTITNKCLLVSHKQPITHKRLQSQRLSHNTHSKNKPHSTRPCLINTHPPKFQLNICCTELGIFLSLHTMPINPPFLFPMEPLMFTFYFTIEGYDVFITIKLFPHINLKMAESTVNFS